MFALRGCQQINVNTLLCDTLGLASNCYREPSGADAIFLGFVGKLFLNAFPLQEGTGTVNMGGVVKLLRHSGNSLSFGSL